MSRALAAEWRPGYLGGDPGPVQVGRDAAKVERPSSAKDHAQVDVLRCGDDALVEHDPDLLRQPLERARGGLRAGRGVIASGEDGGNLRVGREVRQVDRGLP